MRLAEVEVGQSIGTARLPLTRDALVRYAAASGDFNPIHYNPEAASQAGLPGVIAHGMLTMGAAIQIVVDWAGGPAAVVDYEVRFGRPVVVPYPGAAEVQVSGVVAALDASARTARVSLTATCQGTRVLGKATALVRLED